MATGRFLVTGATGTVGSQVVHELGRDARAFVRDPEAARAKLGPDPELAVGDFNDVDSVRRALTGVESVFVACANVPGQVEYENLVIDEAAAAGVRVVNLSAAEARVGAPFIFGDWHGRVEQHIRLAGVPAVVLQPSYYMTNLFAYAGSIAAESRIYAPATGVHVTMIDPRDIAACAVAALRGDVAPGTYPLTGPAAVSFPELAATFSSVLGRPVEFVEVPEDAARAGMAAAGLPELIVDEVIVLFRLMRAGEQSTLSNGVRRLSGQEPRSLATWIADHAAAFS